MGIREGKSRVDAIRKLISQGSIGTQEEICSKLEKLGYEVTQSTISRDLRKLGVIKAIDSNGNTIYRIPDEAISPEPVTSLANMVLSIQTNGSLIVIRTTPGSASLIARYLDCNLPKGISGGILGTLAGDDTIFVAVSSRKSSVTMMKTIELSLQCG